MNTHKKIRKPNLLWHLTDGLRAILEFASLNVFELFYKIPKEGDGHPVLVIPGFLGSGFSTKPLRNFINKLGYSAYDWGLGRNLANFEDIEFLNKRIEDLNKEHNQKVTIIGWSLGGVYARQLAKENKDLVRQVITMGSPFNGANQPNNAKWIYDRVKEKEGTPEADENVIADLPNPAPVPTTAIYSKQDGIIPWEVCMEIHEDKMHQNVRVYGSHLGFGFNPSVFVIIRDRLKYNVNNWAFFKRKRNFFFPGN